MAFDLHTQAVPHSAEQLRRRLGYRKFAGERLKIVVLDSGYHLQNECVLSLRALGHLVRAVTFDTQTPFETLLAELLRTVAGFRPDFLLTINLLGFDRNGALKSLMEDVQMPVAAWFVDSPFFVCRQAQLLAPTTSTTFVWDDAYLGALRRAGTADVHYLPLAADTAMLAPRASRQPGRFPILFVGDSMTCAAAKWRRRVGPAERTSAAALMHQLAAQRSSFTAALSAALAGPDGHVDRLAWATFSATGAYRRSVLAGLPPSLLHIIGDAGWQHVLPAASRHPPVVYGPALAQAFLAAAVNINATSLQMPHAVNQRAFDVPAAGAFLLSDKQSDMTRHFEALDEPCTYSNPKQACEMAQFYLRRGQLRDRLTQQMRRQILRRHTYTHRLAALVHCMRRRHRSGAPSAPKGR